MQTEQSDVARDQKLAKSAIEAGDCTVLGSCFRASMLMEMEAGPKRIDEIREGDLVATRDQHDPEGPIEYKRVVAVYRRTGKVMEVVADGQIIGTTSEHPFYKLENAWVEASALSAGDFIRTKAGWAKVDEVRDTGLFEAVYNVQVEDHHTLLRDGGRLGLKCLGA